jgi:hypothetical protein
MAAEEFFDQLRKLDRVNKLRIIQFLASDLATEAEGIAAPEMERYDALWDKTFEASQDLLDQLANEAHAEYAAGLTEDFDPDTEGA